MHHTFNIIKANRTENNITSSIQNLLKFFVEVFWKLQIIFVVSTENTINNF